MNKVDKSAMAAGSRQPMAITAAITGEVVARRYESLPAAVREWVRHCVLDCIAVAVAGAREPLVNILVEDAKAEGGKTVCGLIGRPERVSPYQAALINGSAAHALDYDDVNLTMEGHPTVAVMPGLLALAETRGSSGADFMTAFLAGYEAACRVGALVQPSHYELGFHNTATVGSFGSAAACAHLLGLDREQTATAFGIAGTQAAGLKAMFGTMCKPLHAGKAARNGLMAAMLAMRGFSSNSEVLEARQGFADSQSRDFNPNAAMAPPQGGFHITNNLFKWHAACYMTHATIEATCKLVARHALRPEVVDEVVVRVAPKVDKMCNILLPHTGLEAKFSLRQTAAFALSGIDTGRMDTFSLENVANPAVSALRDKVRVELVQMSPTMSTVEVVCRDGSRHSAEHDTGNPETDIGVQRLRLERKFRSLVEPALGRPRADQLLNMIGELERLPSMAPFAAALG